MDTIYRALRTNLDAVEARIQAACQRAGRARSDVTLVAVTKSVSVEVARRLPELGVLDLAENRPQELWRKSAALPATVRWHLIGHWQRNKIERTLPIVHCFHAVDSVRLLETLDREGRPLPALLEVNASGEASKQGFAPEQVMSLASTLLALKNVRITGLMTMAALQDPEQCRPTFALLRQLRDPLNAELPGERQLRHLSMGMSNDFEVAIEEGATHIRLGTILFEGLPGY